MKKTALWIMFLTVISIGTLTTALNVRWAKAISGTIYIAPDGSISPPNANITTSDHIMYTFTGNNYLPIIVNRSNIIINGKGRTLQASGSNGFSLSRVSNVTNKNTFIARSEYGISVDSSDQNTLSGNKITANNEVGIYLHSSSNNVLSGNDVTANSNVGIYVVSSSNSVLYDDNVTGNGGDGVDLAPSSGSILCYNNITANGGDDICLWASSSNVLSCNNVVANDHNGIALDDSSGNRIFHDCFSDNTQQTWLWLNSTNTWDDGYPSGGNY